jgi:tetratricopeptide (TPR) repeat protein
VKEDTLFTLEDLTWGFVRPKRPNDRTLAYAQSFWVCKYIQETFGHQTILKMLSMYRDGQLQEEVFPATTGQSMSQFEQNFFAWTRRQVAGWGYDEATQKKYEKLRDRGEDLIKSRKYADAVTAWEEIVQMRPVDALPHQRLAGLYLTKEINNPQKAIEHLRRLHDTEQKDNRYAKRLSRIYRDTKQLSQAIEYAREATMIDPYDLDAQQTLAGLYEQADDPKASKQNEIVTKLKKWHAENRQRNNPQGER